MGWSLSPINFQKFKNVFVNKLRDPKPSARPDRLPNLAVKAKKKWLLRRRLLTGDRLLPFEDDFAIFAIGFNETIRRKNETFALVKIFGLSMHPTKGIHTATQVGEHLEMEMNFEKGVFRRAPVKKL